jgi:AcrR family transcriptional regulator
VTDVRRRGYHSPLRAEQAAASRAAVLAAAHRLFVAQGYGATTIEKIAREAGVSKPTVFAAVGNKLAVLKVVRDVAMAGDDEQLTVEQRLRLSGIESPASLDDLVTATVEHITRLHLRYVDIHEVLRGASGTDPEVRELWQISEAQRLVGAEHSLARLAAWGRPVDGALDRLWLLMAPDNYQRLVRDRGWTQDAFRDWLRSQILELIA